MKLYTVNSWYDVDLLCNDDVNYVDNDRLLVDYQSYKLLKARNVELEELLKRAYQLLTVLDGESTIIEDDIWEAINRADDDLGTKPNKRVEVTNNDVMEIYRIVTDDKTRIIEAKTERAACNIVLRYGADIRSVTKIERGREIRSIESLWGDG